jgi:hypothetical protein
MTGLELQQAFYTLELTGNILWNRLLPDLGKVMI